MANIEKLAALAADFTTSQGELYKLPPMGLVVRTKALKYLAEVEEINARDIPEVEKIEPIINGLVELLTMWIGRIEPDITPEQIREDWDIPDLDKLSLLIMNQETEIQAAIPPAGSVPAKPRIGSRKK